MAIRMQQRRGTSEQWTSANPVLAPGEVGFETDNNQFKIGDGVNQWNDLAYFVNIDGISGTLGDYILLAEKGIADGVATLDAQGQVPADQLGNATVDLSDYATESYVDTAVSDLVSSAPEALDTLNELAAALNDDENFATTVTDLIAGKADSVHTHDLEDITDFDINSPVENQIFKFNGTNWINVAAGGGVQSSTTPPEDTEAFPLWYDTTKGKAYIYYDNFWVELAPSIAGPVGPTGANGATGPAGPQGTKGDDGIGIAVLGSFANDSFLPATGNVGDGYLINGDLYVWDDVNSNWTNAGNIQGPTGSTGPAGADGADGATGPAGPTGSTGPAGADGADGATGPAGADGADGADGATGSTGPAGADGADGVGIAILGSFSNENELPAVGNPGDGYLINGDLYVWDDVNSNWNDAGNIQGPTGSTGADGAAGPTGPTGPAGADGAAGPTGPQGPAGANGADGADGLGSGDVAGPESSTDNAVARYDSTTGKLLQNSLATISDAGAISTPNNTGSKISFYFENFASFPSAADSHGAVAHNHETGKMYYAHAGAWIEIANLSDIPAAGATTFNATTDATTAGITIDQMAYSAIARLPVTAVGTSAYQFNSHYSGNNPTIFVLGGATIAFNLSEASHPFALQQDTGSGFSNITAGLIHVTTAGVITTNVSAQGKVSGTLYWNVPITAASGSYRYICLSHGSMVGTITHKSLSAI